MHSIFLCILGNPILGKKWAWEHLAACCRYTSCELLLRRFLSNQNLLKHLKFTPSWYSEHLPLPSEESVVTQWWWQGQQLHQGNHFHCNYRCHCRSSELVTHLTSSKALLWLLLSSCLYNLWILSQSWTRVYFPTLTLVLNFAARPSLNSTKPNRNARNSNGTGWQLQDTI